MNNAVTEVRVGYFGKIPSRGDFVKATDNIPLVEVLDNWLAQTMGLLSEDPRWKIDYDEAHPLDFAFIGPRKKRAIAGHIINSRDSAQRRFPLLTLSELEADNPVAFVRNSPLILSRLWDHLGTQGSRMVSASDTDAPLQYRATGQVQIERRSSAHEVIFNSFLESQTLGTLDSMLASTGFNGNARQILLALGMLLYPLMTCDNIIYPEKSLELPLPKNPAQRHMVAAYWMHLITPFLLKADFELALFLTHAQQQPKLVLGFGGASPRTLQAILQPQIGSDHHIAFENAQWVEEQIKSDYGLKNSPAIWCNRIFR